MDVVLNNANYNNKVTTKEILVDTEVIFSTILVMYKYQGFRRLKVFTKRFIYFYMNYKLYVMMK